MLFRSPLQRLRCPPLCASCRRLFIAWGKSPCNKKDQDKRTHDTCTSLILVLPALPVTASAILFTEIQYSRESRRLQHLIILFRIILNSFVILAVHSASVIISFPAEMLCNLYKPHIHLLCWSLPTVRACLRLPHRCQ